MSKIQVNYDKKQLPQVIVMGVLSLGLLGYAASILMAPPPTARAAAAPGAPAAAATPVASTAGAAPATSTSTVDGSEPVAGLIDAVAPSQTMRDPFVSCIQQITTPTTPAPPPVSTAVQNFLKPPTQTVAAMPAMPSASVIRPLSDTPPILPSMTAIQPAAAPPPPLTVWTVTGVLFGSGSAKKIAVLRSADSRRYVALGSMVDDQYRLIGIDRFGVTLQQGKTRLRLKLGGDAPAPTVSTAATASASTPAGGAQTEAVTQSPSAASTTSQVSSDNSSGLDPLTLN